MPKYKSKLHKHQQKKLKSWLARGFSREYITAKAKELHWPELTEKMFQYWTRAVDKEYAAAEEEEYKNLYTRSFADKRERILTLLTMGEQLWVKDALSMPERKELRSTMTDLRNEIEGFGKAETININFVLQQASVPLLRGMEYVIVQLFPDREDQRRAFGILQNFMREFFAEAGRPLALPSGIHREQILDSGQEPKTYTPQVEPSPGDDTRGD